MKKYYNYGEIILILREEYKECKHLLEELNCCINVKSDNSSFHFSGIMSKKDDPQDLSDRRIQLFVEKRYLDILKKIQYLKYDWYGQYLYCAYFNVEKKDNNMYGLTDEEIETPVDGSKFMPKVEIIDQNKFSSLVDEIFSSNLMQLKQGCFEHNSDVILLNFHKVNISTKLGDHSFISWNGIRDDFDYSITRHYSRALIEDILSLEIPTDKISPDWIELLEKHENLFGKKFDVDIDVQSKKGILQLYDIKNSDNNNIVKLLKKPK